MLADKEAAPARSSSSHQRSGCSPVGVTQGSQDGGHQAEASRASAPEWGAPQSLPLRLPEHGRAPRPQPFGGRQEDSPGGGGTTSPRARATDPEPAAPDRCPRPHPQRRPVCRPHPHTGNFLSALRSPPYEQTIAAHQKPREVPYVENRPKPTGWRVGVLRGRERTGREQDCRDEKLKLNKSVTNIFRDVRSSLYP